MLKTINAQIDLSVFIENLADGILGIIGSGEIVVVNENFCRLTQHSRNDLIGANLSKVLPPTISISHQKHIVDFFLNPKPRSMANDLEIALIRKDGTSVPVEIGLSNVKTEYSQIGLAYVKNISARKKAEEELKQQVQELDSFAHMVAHDIRSIITTIVGYSEYLLKNNESISKDIFEKYMSEIALAGRKMGNITQDILLFASMKKQDMELVPVNVNDYLHGALERLKLLIENKSASITVKDKLPDCCGYGPWIEEIWYNFLINAINYGGDQPHIEIGYDDVGNGYIKYYVKDSGPGITLQNPLDVFSDNGDLNKKFVKGNGIGLPMVKKIVNKLDGFVDLETKSGMGCNFSFSLKSIHNLNL